MGWLFSDDDKIVRQSFDRRLCPESTAVPAQEGEGRDFWNIKKTSKVCTSTSASDQQLLSRVF